MADDQIARILITKGEALFQAPAEYTVFSGNKQADAQLNDLTNHSHVFVLACLMHRQVNAEKAWLVPYLLSQRIGGFEFHQLAALSGNQIKEYMAKPTPLHRFTDIMSECLYSAIQRIADKYNRIASRIWAGEPSSAEVIYRFLEFRGIGQKIGTMAANILARDFKVKLSDYYSINVSVDVHVKRVFTRLGLIPISATDELVIYRARSLSPTFPGLLDLPCWDIGRNWCKPTNPSCSACSMNAVCPRIMQ